MKFRKLKSERKLFKLLREYMLIFSSKGFWNDLRHVGKNAVASMRHTRINANISSFTQSQNTISIRQEIRAIVSLQVICFSPYFSERRKMITHTRVLAASDPNPQISSPF